MRREAFTAASPARPAWAGRALVSVLAAAALLVAAPAQSTPGPADLAAEVDPMIGTFAPGFVVPGAATPWGMVQNSPDTTGPFAYSGYLWSDPVIRGFSLVHLSGPGVKKAGDVPFTPWVGPLPRSEDPNLYASPFDHATETASPGAYSVVLGSGTKVDLAASTRGALQRYAFPPSPQANVLVDIVRSAEGTSGRDGHVEVDPATRTISGWTAGRYRVFFAGQFDRPWTASAAWGAGGRGVALTFDTTVRQAVTLRVAVSFVDAAGARANLAADAPDFDVAAMRGRARAAWNAELNRVQVAGGTALDRRTLYTSLYHSLLHPNVFEDADRRYLGFDGAVHTAADHVHYANFSSWDTYKSQNQLLATLWPDRYRDMALSLLDDYAEGGRLPRWGEQNFDAAHMSGDPAIPLLADAVCRGLLSDDAVPRALAASVDLVSRRPADLLALGYLPERPGTTLEYGVADFALALLARRAGDADVSAAALARSHNWRNTFDPAAGWIRPRRADGSWAGAEPFDPTSDEGFQEGNSWQYSWLAPHDAADLFDAMGGVDAAAGRLDQLFAAPPEVQTRLTGFGTVYRAPQYAPGNEHDLQVPWMLASAGRTWRLAEELREVQQVFRPTIDGLPGNDDLGGLSSWQAQSVLGFGPLVPGAPLFVVGAPAFASVSLRVGGGWFTVRTSGLGGYVQSASLNGKPLERSWFEADKVRPGGSLELAMGPLPSGWATAVGARPPSARDGLAAFACE